MSQLLIPIRNFSEVDADKKIYRSAQPEYSYEYRFLKFTLGIETVINLRAELDHDSRYCELFRMKHLTIGMADHTPPTLKQATDFIRLIKSESGILFHCEHGHGRTSLFCVLARIAMGWTLEKAMKEESEVFGYKWNHPAQVNFLETNFSNINK